MKFWHPTLSTLRHPTFKARDIDFNEALRARMDVGPVNVSNESVILNSLLGLEMRRPNFDNQ